MMKCPNCQSSHTIKYGKNRGKQRYRCKNCQRQFIDSYTEIGYDRETIEKCLKMYLNGMGFRGIERVMEIHHTTIIGWLKKYGHNLNHQTPQDEIPEITQIDELQTFIGKKK